MSESISSGDTWELDSGLLSKSLFSWRKEKTSLHVMSFSREDCPFNDIINIIIAWTPTPVLSSLLRVSQWRCWPPLDIDLSWEMMSLSLEQGGEGGGGEGEWKGKN